MIRLRSTNFCRATTPAVEATSPRVSAHRTKLPRYRPAGAPRGVVHPHASGRLGNVFALPRRRWWRGLGDRISGRDGQALATLGNPWLTSAQRHNRGTRASAPGSWPAPPTARDAQGRLARRQTGRQVGRSATAAALRARGATADRMLTPNWSPIMAPPRTHSLLPLHRARAPAWTYPGLPQHVLPKHRSRKRPPARNDACGLLRIKRPHTHVNTAANSSRSLPPGGTSSGSDPAPSSGDNLKPNIGASYQECQ